MVVEGARTGTAKAAEMAAQRALREHRSLLLVLARSAGAEAGSERLAGDPGACRPAFR